MKFTGGKLKRKARNGRAKGPKRRLKGEPLVNMLLDILICVYGYFGILIFRYSVRERASELDGVEMSSIPKAHPGFR